MEESVKGERMKQGRLREEWHHGNQGKNGFWTEGNPTGHKFY